MSTPCALCYQVTCWVGPGNGQVDQVCVCWGRVLGIKDTNHCSEVGNFFYTQVTEETPEGKATGPGVGSGSPSQHDV